MLIQLYSLGFMTYIYFFYHMSQLWLFSDIKIWLHCFWMIMKSRKTSTLVASTAAQSRHFTACVHVCVCGGGGGGANNPHPHPTLVWQMVRNIQNHFCCTSYAITKIYNEQTIYLKTIVCRGVTLCSLVDKYIDMKIGNWKTNIISKCFRGFCLKLLNP